MKKIIHSALTFAGAILIALVSFFSLSIPHTPASLKGTANTALQENTRSAPRVLYFRKSPTVARLPFKHVLRWKNHTINLHLRNVRGEWLAFRPTPVLFPTTYPSEDIRILS